MWPYVRRTSGSVGLAVAGLDGARVFECKEGGVEALAAADAEVGSQATMCCLCEKSCPRAGSGFDSFALLHAHWELYQLLSDVKYDQERCGFCCAPAVQCGLTLAPFGSNCRAFNQFKPAKWDDERGSNSVLPCPECLLPVWRPPLRCQAPSSASASLSASGHGGRQRPLQEGRQAAEPPKVLSESPRPCCGCAGSCSCACCWCQGCAPAAAVFFPPRSWRFGSPAQRRASLRRGASPWGTPGSGRGLT